MGAQTAKTSPPSGTGHVPGFGESFNINLNTGQGVYSYKIALPDGVAGHTPSLSLEYASSNQYTTFGWGWNIGIRKITRRLDKGAANAAEEEFMDGGLEILPMADGTYKSRMEALYSRYTRKNQGWLIQERTGIRHELGVDPNNRLTDPGHPDRIYEWPLEKSIDTSGHEIFYHYQHDDGICYLDRIEYAIYKVKFHYEDRPDKRLNGKLGFLRRHNQRCHKIELLVKVNNSFQRHRSWNFEYLEEDTSGLSLLVSIKQTGHGEAVNGSGDITLPPATFEYQTHDPGKRKLDFISTNGQTGPPALTEQEASLINMNNNPLPGILYNQGGKQLYWENNGKGAWLPPRPIKDVPFVSSFAMEGAVFGDMDASGNADMLVLGPNGLNGYYENKGKLNWDNFVAYPRAKRTFPSLSEATRFVDTDGNGVVDAITSTNRAFHVLKNQRSQGWDSAAVVSKSAAGLDEVKLDDPHYHLADVTGDGLMDIVHIGSGRIDYWPSLGHGHFGDKRTMMNAPRLPKLHAHLDHCFFTDINGNGCADLVLYDGKQFVVCYNKNGKAFSEAYNFDLLPAPLSGSMRAIDFYGEGKTGILYNTWSNTGIKYVYLTFGGTNPGYSLNKVINGYGLESEIFYKPAVHYYYLDYEAGHRWSTHFPFPIQVVSGMKETDLITGYTSEQQIIYHNAHFNADLRQFQGFSKVEKIDKGDESCPDKKSIYEYLMGQEYAPGQTAIHAALNGKMHRLSIYALDGSPTSHLPYTIEESTYSLKTLQADIHGNARVAILLDTYTQTHTERSDDKRVEEKTYEYDDFGNVTQETQHAHGLLNGQPVASITSTVKYQYAINEAQWILDRVAVTSVSDKDGNVTGETRKFYDGNAFEGLPLGQVSKGREMREARFVMDKTTFMNHYNGMDISSLGYFEANDLSNKPAIFFNHKRSKYDNKGLRIGEMDALGHAVSIDYHSTGLFKTKYISPLGENNYTTDIKLGLTTAIQGPDNTILRLNYDALGRLIDVFTPENTSSVPTRSYVFDQTLLPLKRITKFYHSENSNDFSQVITYFDGASGEIQNRIQTANNKFSVSEYKVKNTLGKVTKEYLPYYSNSEAFDMPDLINSDHQSFEYDVMGRPIKTTNVYGGVSTASYDVFEVQTSDPIDNSNAPDLVARGLTKTPKIEKFNVLRDRTETLQKLANGEETKLTYQLTDWGQLESITDDHGVLATYLYDHQGNRLVTDHREAGIRKVWYNALKQPVKGTDANNNVIQGAYDGLNRLKTLHANGNLVESYTYDDAASNAIGRLSEVTYEKGSQQYVYDHNGQTVKKTFRFDDRPAALHVEFGYDRLGRRTSVKHDDGTTINFNLTANGWIKAIPGVVDEILYDAMGNPVNIAYTNKTITELTYAQGGRKIKTQKVTNKNNQVLENLEYEYLQDGSLLRMLDKTTNQTVEHSYQYNALNELERYRTTQSGNIEDHHYEYEDHLNLKTMGDTGFTLFRDDAAHPGQITKMVSSNQVETPLNYDNNGNLLNLPDRTFVYNYKNAISRMDHANGIHAEYFYSHKEQRIQKTVVDGNLTTTTFFLDNIAEYRNTQQAFYIYLGNIRIAMLQDGVTHWIHSNYLGNTSFYSDANGTKISSIAYKPFGNTASISGNVPAHTFGTHPYDHESGLYYAKKRYYSPEIGAFMSCDPVAVFQPKRVIGSIKAFQCYAYTGNDPTNNVDTTGLSFWSVFGAIVGAIVGIALVVFAGPLAALIIGIGIITLSYILASNNVNNDFGEFMRGFMIGFNAGMNAMIGSILFGPLIGTALGVINFLAAFDSIAQNEIYKGILGWSSWLMPMSWVVTGLGLIFFVINLIVAGITFQQVDRVKIHSIDVNWQTGMIIMEGGLITYPPGGFNMGNFSFYGEGHTSVIYH